MLKARIFGGLAVAALTAALAATTAANGATSRPSSPAEKAATAELNKKIVVDNHAVDAQEQAKKDTYQQEVTRQRIQYEEQVKTYELQKQQYEQQMKNAQFNTAPPPSPAP
jgi:hypothetical protein